MKPSITKAGICTAVTAAAITTVTGLVPIAALAAPALPELPQKLAGKTVFLDPGHQGPNHTQDVNKQVSDGRGGTKACQTTGMTSLHGMAEHTINWNVAQLVRTSLEGLGAKVVMSRPDDTGWGGCIDERAKAANASGADVALSIHADSGPADGHGFHLIVPQLPVPDAKVNEVQSGAGLTATKAMRDAYVQGGYQAATYNGAVDGLQTRSDIAGPALTSVPDVFLEMGNGANAEDAAQLESPEGQLKHAVTIVTGLASYLLGVPVPAESASEPGTQPGQQVPAEPAQAQVPAPAAPAPAQPAPAQTPQTPQAAVPAPQAQVPQTQPQAQVPQAQLPQTQPQAQTPGQAQTPAQPGSVPAQSGSAPAQAPQLPTPAEVSPERAGTPQPADGLQVFQQLADQFLNWEQQAQQGGQVAPQPAAPQPAAPQPAAPQPAAPQAVPAQPAKPGVAPAVKPVADQRAPRQSPGTSAAPQTPSPAAPGAQSNPGAQSPSTDKNSKSDGFDVDTMSTLVQSAIKFFGPLAKMLMGNTGIAPDLINLAYSVVSVLSSNMLKTPTTVN
ncbi:N-acetylmuramoyl-L-alanine amidase [Nocardia sp. CDC153]|uniref:N-acetylmuramoyl-L-alanine amidase n=1 Tax=Nocardia sp. CDC153 TaxID=3112167 RepID=UPI003FA35614